MCNCKFCAYKYTCNAATVDRFNDCSPSLSMIVSIKQNLLSESNEIERINTMQNHFKNSVLIVVGDCSSAEWVEIQMKVALGNLRLYQTISIVTCAQLVLGIYESMKSKERFERQVAYFKHLQNETTSHHCMQRVLSQCLLEMGIDEENVKLLIRHFRSTERLFLQSANTPIIPGISKESMEMVHIFVCTHATNLKAMFKTMVPAMETVYRF
jgi:ERCC4-type nuclease